MNSRSPLISVIIPTYNHAGFLRAAIESVLSQTYENYEIIVIDNHSTDETEEVVNSYKSDRLRYIKIHNKGVIAISRNAGIENANGEWLAFLDSDDKWYPEKLKIVVDNISQNPDFSVFCTNEYIKNENGILGVLKYGPFKKQHFYRFLIESGNCISTSACVVKKNFIEERKIQFSEDERYVTAEDYEYWMQLARSGAKFKFIPSIQGEYFIHTNNQSGNTERHKKSVKAVLFDHVMRFQKFQEPSKLWKLIEARMLFEEGLEEIKCGEINKTFYLMMRSIATGKLLFFKILKIKILNKIDDILSFRLG